MAWLERLELAAAAKKKVEELSKGMQQKIQLVATVLHEPDIVILDEPFSGLDPINQTLFKDAFAELQKQGKTLLFCTHVMEQAERLCDEICLISGGRAILQGNLREIRRGWGGNAYRLVGERRSRVARHPSRRRRSAGEGRCGARLSRRRYRAGRLPERRGATRAGARVPQ